MTKAKKSEFIIEVIPLEPLSLKALRSLYGNLKTQHYKLLKELDNKERAFKGVSKTVKKWRDACMEEKKKLMKMTVAYNSLKRSIEEKEELKRVKISEVMKDIKKEKDIDKDDPRWMMF